MLKMKTKTLLSILPNSFRERLFYRYFHKRYSRYRNLYKESALAYAPQYIMHDLVPGDIISGQIAFNGFYEYSLSKEIAKLAKAGGTFVDVGANLGYFTLLWLGGNLNNTAIAVEASPRNKDRILNNIQRNRLEDRVEFHAFAAGDEAKKVVFEIGPEDQTGWGKVQSDNNSPHSVEVEMIRLDSIINSPIDVLKIDVEGADTLVLKGCSQLLEKKQIKRIFFEQNEENMQKLGIGKDEAVTLLNQYGYKCSALSADETEWTAVVE